MAAEVPTGIPDAIGSPRGAVAYLSNVQLFTISTMAFAVSALWGSVLTLIAPIQVGWRTSCGGAG